MSNYTKQQRKQEFACLYSRHKTQKKKIWKDGKLVLNNTSAVLYDACPALGLSDLSKATVDACELTKQEVVALLRGEQTMLETEKFLIQVDDLWIEQPKKSLQEEETQVVRPIWRPLVSNHMQKVMKQKFRKPGTFIPPNRAPPCQSQSVLAKRRRMPLQPGELQRIYYGNDNVSANQSDNTTSSNNSLPLSSAWKAQACQQPSPLQQEHPKSNVPHTSQQPIVKQFFTQNKHGYEVEFNPTIQHQQQQQQNYDHVDSRNDNFQRQNSTARTKNSLFKGNGFNPDLFYGEDEEEDEDNDDNLDHENNNAYMHQDNDNRNQRNWLFPPLQQNPKTKFGGNKKLTMSTTIENEQQQKIQLSAETNDFVIRDKRKMDGEDIGYIADASVASFCKSNNNRNNSPSIAKTDANSNDISLFTVPTDPPRAEDQGRKDNSISYDNANSLSNRFSKDDSSSNNMNFTDNYDRKGSNCNGKDDNTTETVSHNELLELFGVVSDTQTQHCDDGNQVHLYGGSRSDCDIRVNEVDNSSAGKTPPTTTNTTSNTKDIPNEVVDATATTNSHTNNQNDTNNKKGNTDMNMNRIIDNNDQVYNKFQQQVQCDQLQDNSFDHEDELLLISCSKHNNDEPQKHYDRKPQPGLVKLSSKNDFDKKNNTEEFTLLSSSSTQSSSDSDDDLDK